MAESTHHRAAPLLLAAAGAASLGLAIRRVGRRSGATGAEGCAPLAGDSADTVVPELQHLAVGDRVPDSHDWSTFFTVVAVEPERALVLHSTRHVLKPMRSNDFTWAFVSSRTATRPPAC